jgi:ParB-like chromosome segregation protein Spo0J
VFLPGGTNAKASAVYAQMRKNYPPDSIAWIKSIKWILAEVPLDDIDWASEARWAAHHQQDKVDHFAAQLQAHQKVDPAVGIIQQGETHFRVVDGHHRSLACKKIGWPARMYVGVVEDEATAHAALETHLYQVHQGADPGNR